MTTPANVDPRTGEILQESGKALARVPSSVSVDLERRRGVAGLLRPVEEPAALLLAQESTRALVTSLLVEDRDYGTIPGTSKMTLLQPGAQRIAGAFGCGVVFEVEEAEVDHVRAVSWQKKKKRWKGRVFDGWEIEEGTSQGFYRYVIRARLVHRGTGVEVGEGTGICCTLEDRYVDCPRDLEHTIRRMAEKRALVAAVLGTFGLSDSFGDVAEAAEERAELPPEELLKLLRPRYFAILGELMSEPGPRELARAAFQEAHPELPGSSQEWGFGDFQVAVGALEKHGADALRRAVAWKAKADPATSEDRELLAALRDARLLPVNSLGFLAWLENAGVGTWLRAELHRVREAGPTVDGAEGAHAGTGGLPGEGE